MATYSSSCNESESVLQRMDKMSGTLFEYSYDASGRTVTVSNKSNRSCYRSVIRQAKDNSGDFVNVSRTDEGDIYIIMVKYDESGREVLLEQFNKVKGTRLTVRKYYPSTGNTCVFITDYNGIKGIGFRTDFSVFKVCSFEREQ